MKKTNIKRTIASVLAAAGIFLAACGNNAASGSADETSGGNGNGVDYDSAETIRIGSMFELTGPAAAYGNSTANAVKLAAKEINENGGVMDKEIELVEYDIKSDEAEAASVSTRLASRDNVSAIIGPDLTGTTQASIPAAQEYGVPLVTPTATDDNLLTDDNGNVFEYIWRTCFTNSYQGGSLAKFANEELGATRAVILGDNSSDYAIGLSNEFKANFDGEIVAEENFTAGQTDFSAVLTNIQNMDFDVIFVPGYYEEAGPIIKQAREMGIDQAIMGPDGMGNEILIELAGQENMDNVYYTSHFVTTSDDPAVQSFVQAFEAEFNTAPDMFSGLAYDAMMLVAQAIEEAGSAEPEAINEALKNIENFEGVTGTFSFDEGHDPVKSVSIIEFQGGEQTGVHEVDPTE